MILMHIIHFVAAKVKCLVHSKISNQKYLFTFIFQVYIFPFFYCFLNISIQIKWVCSQFQPIQPSGGKSATGM